MTVARLQQIYLYYSYAVLAVLLFILLKQDDFALYWVLFYPLFCNHAIFDLADCLKNQKPFYDKFYALMCLPRHFIYLLQWAACCF